MHHTGDRAFPVDLSGVCISTHSVGTRGRNPICFVGRIVLNTTLVVPDNEYLYCCLTACLYLWYLSYLGEYGLKEMPLGAPYMWEPGKISYNYKNKPGPLHL